MSHPIIIEVDPTGAARAVFHPNQAPEALWAQGELLRSQAGAQIVPAQPQLRRAFCWLRRVFGRAGLVAAFTRRWPCAWRVVLPGGHCSLPGVFADRDAAIAAEVAWLLQRQ